MEEPIEMKNKEGWMSVPEFGEWEKKEGVQDYSMDFNKIRRARKLSKTRLSVGNYEELHPHHDHPNLHSHHHLTSSDQFQVSPPSKWKRLLSYFTCCTKT